MNFYVLINSAIYVLAWNLVFFFGSEVPTLVIGWSFLLFAPLFFISEVSRGKDDRWFYRSFKDNPYDRFLIVISVLTGIVGGALSWIVDLMKGHDLYTMIAFGIFTVLNAILVAAIQFALYVKLKRREGNGF